MLFYFTLFLVFLYFKIARVHKKEERVDNKTYISYFIVAISAIGLYNWGISHYGFLFIALFSFIFFIVAALMVTAVQVGIFIDGKPLIGISMLYKSMPYLAGIIGLFTILVYIAN
jgi:hypothetical protein